jgi:hypothetical protein
MTHHFSILLAISFKMSSEEAKHIHNIILPFIFQNLKFKEYKNINKYTSS